VKPTRVPEKMAKTSAGPNIDVSAHRRAFEHIRDQEGTKFDRHLRAEGKVANHRCSRQNASPVTLQGIFNAPMQGGSGGAIRNM
jgi:hypothetical protein